MSKIKISGNASGTGVVTLTAPNTNTDRTITLPDDTQTLIGTNASGNVGIGTTSPTDFTNRKSLDIGAGGKIWSHNSSVETGIGNNFYYTSGYKYLTTQVASKHNQDDNGHSFQVAASGTADAAITWNTGFEVLADGKARAKNGLLFGTDTAAANALDDYEEGTWTPTFQGSTTGTPTYTIRVGHYTKIGNKVHVQGRIAMSTLGTVNGNLYLQGLPFTASSTANNASVAHIGGWLTGFTITAGHSPSGYVDGTNFIYLTMHDSTGGMTDMTGADVSDAVSMMFQMDYLV